MSPAMSAAEVAEARRLLEPIEHIVVLMLENRSFDHKFGYLAAPGAEPIPDRGELPVDVRAVAPDDPLFPITFDGHDYRREPATEDDILAMRLDPPHDHKHVATQLASHDGFLKAFADKIRATDPQLARDPRALKTVLGYLPREHVPISDHLARNYCLCDNWFCSVPGPTLPNRFFAVAGTIHDVYDNVDLMLGEFGKFQSFFRHLEHDQWRWYSSDPAILRAVDEDFTVDEREDDHFAYFEELTEKQPRSFLRDAIGDARLEPGLRPVSWIDPNFAMSLMLPKFLAEKLGDGPSSDDDHPPAPSVAGQRLVHKVFRALGEGGCWDKTLLIVTYDEHGGFFDHVKPPSGLGPRIPVLLVGPHVKRGVCHERFDHASVIKTILLRFGRDGSWNDMGPAVRDANDLSVAMRDDGGRVEYAPVANPGAAAIQMRELMPAFLPHNGSTLGHALGFQDDKLTDLQLDLVYGIVLRLRTGASFAVRARHSPFFRKRVLPILKRFYRPRKRLEPRRP